MKKNVLYSVGYKYTEGSGYLVDFCNNYYYYGVDTFTKQFLVFAQGLSPIGKRHLAIDINIILTIALNFEGSVIYDRIETCVFKGKTDQGFLKFQWDNQIHEFPINKIYVIEQQDYIFIAHDNILFLQPAIV
jgi:hypothetical protein